MRLPGFTADASFVKVNPDSGHTTLSVDGSAEHKVIPQQLDIPSNLCDTMPWLCETCGECNNGLQTCWRKTGNFNCIRIPDPLGRGDRIVCNDAWAVWQRRC